VSSMDPLANSAWSRPATVAGFMQSAPNDVLLRYAERERRRAPTARALDLGCGAGRNALPLVRSGWGVVGVDLSWPMFHGSPQDALSANRTYSAARRPGQHAASVLRARGDLVLGRVRSRLHRIIVTWRASQAGPWSGDVVKPRATLRFADVAASDPSSLLGAVPCTGGRARRPVPGLLP
jgi:hypothetical protein